MTDKNIRGQNFNYLSLEERENTREVKFSVWETDWMELVEDKMSELITNFDGYNGNGTFKVTIEFHSEDEVEDG
jgi:hypothetical protein